MKKIVIYITLFTIIIFIIPAILTKGAIDANIISNLKTVSASLVINGKKETIENINNIIDIEEISDGYIENIETTTNTAITTIKLLHEETGIVEEININEYLYGVVASEMPVSYESEALKAQAVVARTYTIYKMSGNKHESENADICDNYACCQAWISKEERFSTWEESECESNWLKIQNAVNSTNEQIITYEGVAIAAFFHANSGGTTEIPLNVWGGSNYPYLQAVETSGEDQYSQYSSEVEYTFDELVEKIKVNYEDIQIDFDEENSVEILEYTDEGRIKTIKFGNHNLSRYRSKKCSRIKIY